MTREKDWTDLLKINRFIGPRCKNLEYHPVDLLPQGILRRCYSFDFMKFISIFCKRCTAVDPSQIQVVASSWPQVVMLGRTSMVSFFLQEDEVDYDMTVMQNAYGTNLLRVSVLQQRPWHIVIPPVSVTLHFAVIWSLILCLMNGRATKSSSW